MAVTTYTTAATAIPELWSQLTADEREDSHVLANLFDRRHEEEASGKPYDTIHIQGTKSFSTTPSYAPGSAPGSLTFAAARFESQVDLVINTHAYQAFDLESDAELFSNINLMSKYAHWAGYSVAKTIDTDCAQMLDAFSTTVGVLGDELDINDIVNGKRLLDSANVPEDDRYFYMSPYQSNAFLLNERLVNALYSGTLGNLKLNTSLRGAMGTHLGMAWYASNNCEGTDAAGHDNGIFHKEAVALAIIDNMRMVSSYEISTDSTRYAVHAIYGLIEVRDDHGIWMKGL